jgi:tripartite-type tricarboxylate transporter receptor subunit TctC
LHFRSRQRAIRLAAVPAALLGLLAVPCMVRAAPIQTVEQFYTGRQVKFVVGTAGGGGYEYYARLVGQFMTRHLRGHPTFVLQDMPGAGGIIAANYLYNVAKMDGSEIGMVGRAVGTQPLLDPKDKGPRYDAAKFNWIGTPQQEVGLVLVRQPSPIKTIHDLRKYELVVSGTTSASPPSYYPRLMNKLLGTRFKVVDGYKGSQEALFALEKGEVDGHSSGSSSAILRGRIEPWLKAGKVKILAQIGLEKDPEFPDVPLILELANSAAERQILEVVFTQQAMAWPVVAPPGLPAERVKALREAFDAAMADPEFHAEAARQKLVINPVSGARIAELLDRVYATPKDLIDQVVSLSERR